MGRKQKTERKQSLLKRLEENKRKRQETSKKNFGAEELREALPEARPPRNRNNAPNPNKPKNKGRILKEESEQFARVLQHPHFKADPARTISEHLRNKMAFENNKK